MSRAEARCHSPRPPLCGAWHKVAHQSKRQGSCRAVPRVPSLAPAWCCYSWRIQWLHSGGPKGPVESEALVFVKKIASPNIYYGNVQPYREAEGRVQDPPAHPCTQTLQFTPDRSHLVPSLCTYPSLRPPLLCPFLIHFIFLCRHQIASPLRLS